MQPNFNELSTQTIVTAANEVTQKREVSWLQTALHNCTASSGVGLRQSNMALKSDCRTDWVTWVSTQESRANH